MKKNILSLLVLPLLLATSCTTPVADFTSDDVDDALAYCRQQVLTALTQLSADSTYAAGTHVPRNIPSDGSAWTLRPISAEEWCSGFWPGILWQLGMATDDATLLDEAQRLTEPFWALATQPCFDHDLGFLVITTLMHEWEYADGDDDCRAAIVACADTLATLYNPAVGTLLSWPRHVADYGGHNTIIDNMLNLELLFWASNHGGDSRLYDIAVSHADTTMAYQFRPDATVSHVAIYDPHTGRHLRCCTHQGYSDSSLWARGQAWAIYGYTLCYRETHEPRYLAFAQRVTDAYLRRLPADGVPYWDFDDPRIATSPADDLVPSATVAPRDASAAAVVASALIELSQYVEDPALAEHYLAEAKHMLRTLSSPSYRCGDGKPAFLLHATGHHPAGSEIDASIVYADYYYLQALLRLKALYES